MYCSAARTYPIRSNNHLRRLLETDTNYLDNEAGHGKYNPESKYKYYHLEFDRRVRKGLKNKMMRFAQNAIRLVARKHRSRYPVETIWFGSQWWIFTRRTMEYILQYVDEHPRFVRFFSSSLCPDESFFHTILGNSPYASQVKPSLTRLFWSEGLSSPDEITEQHLQDIASPECDQYCFVRKFNDSGARVAAMIDQTCRKEV